jgi:hypothetical protein
MSAEALAPWQDLLAKLGSDIGLAGVAFTEEGYCSLGLEDGRVLHLDVEDDSLVLMMALGEAPAGAGRLKVLEALLAANAFWIGTQGATLALDPDLRQVLLMRKEPLAVLERQGLREVVEDVIEAAERLAAVLQPAGEALTPTDADDAMPLDMRV